VSHQGIRWVFDPAPTLGAVAWEGTATCPHGESTHIVFAPVSVLMEQAPNMVGGMLPGRCDCQVVEVVVKNPE